MNLYMDLALGSRQPCARLSKMSRPICQRLQRLPYAVLTREHYSHCTLCDERAIAAGGTFCSKTTDGDEFVGSDSIVGRYFAG